MTSSARDCSLPPVPQSRRILGRSFVAGPFLSPGGDTIDKSRPSPVWLTVSSLVFDDDREWIQRRIEVDEWNRYVDQ